MSEEFGYLHSVPEEDMGDSNNKQIQLGNNQNDLISEIY